MKHVFSDTVLSRFACPECGKPLEGSIPMLSCESCELVYPVTPKGQLDLRLKRPVQVSEVFELGTGIETDGINFSPLDMHPSPEVDFSDGPLPLHFTWQLLSHIPKAKDGEMMLDLGCGKMPHKVVAEKAGYEYVGVDYDNKKAAILGDGHRLPFQDNTFACVISIAAFEHIRYPFTMIREINRVLKPGGKLIGTLAFLEPYHKQSYYHPSHLGTLNLVQYGGFENIRIAPSREFNVLRAQANMILFPGLTKKAAGRLIKPVNEFHKLWWRIRERIKGDVREEDRVLHTSGAFTFLAEKSA